MPKNQGRKISLQPQKVSMYYRKSIYITALIAHLPLFVPYTDKMWGRGHYQFFPLLMAVVGWLIFTRLNQSETQSNQEVGPKTKNNGGLITALLVCDLLLLIVGSLMYAPFYFIPALLALSAAFILDRFGRTGLLFALPCLLLLVLVIAPPSNFDKRLILRLQFMASHLASWILDAFNQVHFRDGVVLITEQKQYFTEEACSGIRSLFSSLAAIGVFGVILEYRLGRHLFNFVQTFVWVIAGNAIRIAIVVFVSDHYTDAIASGVYHELLGLVVFVFIFGMSLSTNRAIEISQQRHEPEEDIDELENISMQAKDLTVGDATRFAKASNLQPTVRKLNAFSIGLIAMFVLVGLFGLRLAYAKNLAHVFRQSDYVVEPVVATALPDVIDGWQQEEFNYIHRGENSPFGTESYAWTFVKAGQKISFSIDGPYPEFHNLARCYPGRGWQTSFDHHYDDSTDGILDDESIEPNCTILKMVKPNSGDYGMVAYSAHDRFNRLVVPKSGSFFIVRSQTIILNNIRLALGLKDPERDFTDNKYLLPIQQFQLLHTSQEEYGQEAHQELETLFQRMRTLLLQSYQAHLSD